MNRALLGIFSASLLITACSGDGDPFNGGEPPSSSFDITSTNGLAATKLAWEAVGTSGDLTGLGGMLGVVAADSGGVADFSSPASMVATNAASDPFGPTVQACLSDGTVTLSGDVADPFTWTRDDTFSVLYEMCDDGAGEVIDGLIDFTVAEFTGDLFLGSYMLSMDAVVTNLQVAALTETLTSNGDASLSLDTTVPLVVYAGTSGASMTTDSNADSEVLTNYQSSQTVDGNVESLPYTMTASGTLDTTELDGVVVYSTPVEFSGEGAGYPSAGQLLIQGTNSSARLTAVDDVNVMIEIDVNNDGTIEHTIETTWTDLTN